MGHFDLRVANQFVHLGLDHKGIQSRSHISQDENPISTSAPIFLKVEERESNFGARLLKDENIPSWAR